VALAVFLSACGAPTSLRFISVSFLFDGPFVLDPTLQSSVKIVQKFPLIQAAMATSLPPTPNSWHFTIIFFFPFSSLQHFFFRKWAHHPGFIFDGSPQFLPSIAKAFFASLRFAFSVRLLLSTLFRPFDNPLYSFFF